MSVGESDRLREYVDALQKQVTDLKDAADQAREETSAQVRARIEQAKADAAAGCGCRANGCGCRPHGGRPGLAR
jgi:hypothetical protein